MKKQLRYLGAADPAEGRQRFHLRPGDWYLTSPACFWHRVLAVPGGCDSSTALLLRSAVLTPRQHSGVLNIDGEVYERYGPFTVTVLHKVVARETYEPASSVLQTSSNGDHGLSLYKMQGLDKRTSRPWKPTLGAVSRALDEPATEEESATDEQAVHL